MRRIEKRRLRYVAPAGVAAVVAAVSAVASMSAGAVTPNLPPITAQDLIARIQTSNVPAVQGDITWTANLGLPDLSGLTEGNAGQAPHATDALDPTSLLSGTHDVKVWSDGQSQRLSLAASAAETDLVRVGDQAWLYDSSTQRVTHYVPSQEPAAQPSTAQSPTQSPATPAEPAPLTPQQEAAKVLADLSPSTLVTAVPGADVAGQHTYLLTLSPKPGTPAASATTLGSLTISVDADNGFPLAVAVYAAGSATPVFEVGYTSISFAAPAASVFAAPVGTSTKTVTYKLPAHHRGQAVHAAATAPPATAPSAAAPPVRSQGGHAPKVTGEAWAWVFSGTPDGGGRADQVLHSSALQGATTAVSGSFGSGRLLHTSLLNVLFLSDGRIFAGFVTPSALEAQAGAPAVGN